MSATFSLLSLAWHLMHVAFIDKSCAIFCAIYATLSAFEVLYSNTARSFLENKYTSSLKNEIK